MPVDTNLEKLIINKNLTKEQFEQAVLDGYIGENELSFVDGEILGACRNIGDIFYTSRLDTELNGAVECNGGFYSTEDFSGNQSIGVLLNSGKLPYVSLEEYASLVSANGSCRAFGWDGGTSFRVPWLNDVYIEAGTALTAGEFISESLPNITGELVEFMHGSGSASTSGAFETTYKSSAGSSSGSGTSYESTTFDASRVSSTYQDGAKVKPNSVRYRAMVQLANEATDEAVITATSALQQIANKVDRSEADYVVENYVNGTEWYRVYKSGWVEQGGSVGADTTSGYPTYTIALLKPMVNNKFNVQVTGKYKSKTAESGNYCYARTTTSISVVSIGYGSDWEVKGQGA